MSRDPRALLWDALGALEAIVEFSAGMSLAEYLEDRLLRSAIERQFEIAGESLAQLSRAARPVADRVPDLAQIVSFRNVLIHGYAQVETRSYGARFSRMFRGSAYRSGRCSMSMVGMRRRLGVGWALG